MFLKKNFRLAFEIICISGLVIQFVGVLQNWKMLPDTIPIHYNYWGVVDRLGDKSNLLYLLGINVVCYIGLTWLGKHPKTINLPIRGIKEMTESQYRLTETFIGLLKSEIVWILTLITLMSINIAVNQTDKIGTFFIPTITILLVLSISGYLLLFCHLRIKADSL